MACSMHNGDLAAMPSSIGSHITSHQFCLNGERRARRTLGVLMNRIRTGCLVALALMLSLTIDSGCSGDSQQPSESSRPRTAGTAKIHYYYDGLGRLVQATSSDGTGVHYAYDPVASAIG